MAGNPAGGVVTHARQRYARPSRVGVAGQAPAAALTVNIRPLRGIPETRCPVDELDACRVRQSTKLCRMPSATACARSRAPNLLNNRRAWVLTVYFGQVEAPTDFGVRSALAHSQQHLQFAFGELDFDGRPGLVPSRCLRRPAIEAARSAARARALPQHQAPGTTVHGSGQQGTGIGSPERDHRGRRVQAQQQIGGLRATGSARLIPDQHHRGPLASERVRELKTVCNTFDLGKREGRPDGRGQGEGGHRALVADQNPGHRQVGHCIRGRPLSSHRIHCCHIPPLAVSDGHFFEPCSVPRNQRHRPRQLAAQRNR